MYAKINQINSTLLSVNESSFAKILSINSDSSIDIELTFTISKSSVIKNDAMTVNISVKDDSTMLTSKFKPDNLSLASKQFISNIVLQGQNAKSSLNSKNRRTIETKVCSLFSKINKSEIRKLQTLSLDDLNSSLLSTKVMNFESVKDIKKSGKEFPILQRSLVNNSMNDKLLTEQFSNVISYQNNSDVNQSTINLLQSSNSLPELRYKFLTNNSFPPSMLSKQRSRVMSFKNSVDGTLKINSDIKTDISSLTDQMTVNPLTTEMTTSDIDQNDFVLVANNQFSDRADYSVVISVPNPLEKSAYVDKTLTKFFVTFELQNPKFGLTVDSLTKLIDVQSLVNEFYTPSLAPTVCTTVNASKQLCIEIKAQDTSTDVVVLKKTISKIKQINNNTSFVTISDKHKLVDGQVRIFNKAPDSSKDVYRVIPVGMTKVLGSAFTDVVVQSTNGFFQNKFVSICTKASITGVTIEVRGISFDVVAIQIVKRDVTLHEKNFVPVDDNIVVITPQQKAEDVIFVYDTTLKNDHVYEYSAKLFFKSGISDYYGSSLIEYVPFVEGVDTQITDVVIDSSTSPDVSFSVQTTLTDSALDDIVKMLDAQNLKSYFSDDILKEREKLQQMIAHNIVRINLSTGDREDFGVITSSTFVDSQNRKINSVTEIDAKFSYRYEVTALLRSTETLFDDFVKTKVDVSTGKNYEFKPSKFNHPIALKKGNLTTPDSLKTHYGKKPMMFGRVGNVEELDVIFSIPKVSISNAGAIVQNGVLNLSWTVSGSTGSIDHYVIISITNGVRKIIGTAHSQMKTNECKFQLKLSVHDHGCVKFGIIPVLNDCSQLPEIQTGNVLVQ